MNCEHEFRHGSAIVPTMRVAGDFHGDLESKMYPDTDPKTLPRGQTMNYSSGVLVKGVKKCIKCGHSEMSPNFKAYRKAQKL